MNGRKSKALRRQAKKVLYNWYLSLLSDADAKTLTMEDVLMYAQKPSKHYGLGTYHTDKFTLRWFIKQIKRNPNFDIKIS